MRTIMKELSIEEKAKAYDEAVKVIKDNLDALNEITETGSNVVNIQSIRNCFYRAFPELKESEDERIRKALIDYFEDAIKADENPLQRYGIHTDEVIDWLENQKPICSGRM